MKIKKFKSEKNNKEIKATGFDAESLEIDKDRPGFVTSTEDPEKEEKDFKKKINKVEKFESFVTINIDNVENLEIEGELESEDDEDDNEFDNEYEEGCGCCNNCTGEPDCYCGCEDCSCEEIVDDIKKASDLINGTISESIKYHIDNNKPITENIFRPGSDAFFNVLKEARELHDKGKIELCKIDEELYRTTDIGKFVKIKGEIVPLDLPMENIEELNEAKYGKKKVELNHPMRNTGPGKKYYVYVKNPKTGKIKKVTFGDKKGGLTAKVSDPEARKSFAARHKCSMKKDKTKAGYWACRVNRYGHLFGGRTYPGFW